MESGDLAGARDAAALQAIKSAVSRFGGAPKVSEVTGIPLGTLTKNLSGATKMSFETVWRLVDKEVMSFADLMIVTTREGEEPRAQLIQMKSSKSVSWAGARAPRDDFTLVPRLEVQASAGTGSLSYGEDALDYLAFQSEWLRARGINPNAARVLSARGDSMEETIRDGDVLLVDTSINRVKDNSIYIVIYGDVVLVKRIHSRLNGSLQLISDNPRYPPEEVTPSETNLLHVAGRVMWYGRSI
ncbi:phage repressor protein C with HTH and peptisase S24 domain [Rhizobium leguminosarum]